MGLRDIAPILDADARRVVLENTWGHLAPKKNRTYKGRVVFAIGCYDSGELNPTPIAVELKGLDDSPWFYDALSDFLGKLCDAAPVEDPAWRGHARQGCVFEWTGTFRNYVFEGVVRLLLDANDQSSDSRRENL